MDCVAFYDKLRRIYVQFTWVIFHWALRRCNCCKRLRYRLSGRNSSRKVSCHSRSWCTSLVRHWEVIKQCHRRSGKTLTARFAIFQLLSSICIFDAVFHSACLQLAFDAIRGEDVAHCAVFPTRNHDRNILFGGSQHPAVLWIDLVILLQARLLNSILYMNSCGKTALRLTLRFPFKFKISFEFFWIRFFLRNTGIGNAVVMIFQ